MKYGGNIPGEPSVALVAALRKLLKPLIRLLIARGVTQPMLNRLIKESYVGQAEEAFGLDGKRPSDSRIRLLTGVHRKDVQRLRQALHHDSEEVPEIVSTGTQLIARWMEDKTYQAETGGPMALPIRRQPDGSASFDRIVEEVSRKDLRPKVILEELLRLGIVELDGYKRVRLKVEAFVPESGFDEKVFYLGRNIQDHIAAASHNLQDQKPPFLDRSVSYKGLTHTDVQLIQCRAEELGMDALKELNALAASMKGADDESADTRYRFNLGIYFFAEEKKQEDKAP